MQLELRATPEEVMRAVEALQEFARERQVPEKTIFGLALALEECGSNVVNHALKRDARLAFQVAFEHTCGDFIIELRDGGPAFDPTAVADRRLQAEENGPHGGWGVQLARHYTDEIRYRREAGQNILRLAKRLGPATGGTCFPQPDTSQSKLKQEN